MSDSNNKSRVVRVLVAAAVGISLGLCDGALHGDPAEWQAAPVAALLGIANLSACYAVATAVAGAIVPWHFFVYLVPGGFAAMQALTAYLRANPAAELPGLLLAGALSILAAAAAATTASAIFGRTQPRAFVAGPTAAFLGLFLLVALFGGEPSTADGHARSPAFSETGAVRLGADRARRPNVLLLTLDTLRADRLGVYGYRRVRTPNLDRLGTEGALVLNAVTQAATTPPSHASILTGLYPARHGIRGFESGLSLPADHPTLAELLGHAGYATGAVIASVPLRPGSGIERGYESYDFVMPPIDYAFYGFREAVAARVLKRLQIVTDRTGYRPGRTQSDLAIDWISRQGDRPWFLWVHYFDAHDPYAPPARHLMAGTHPGASVTDLLQRAYLYDSEVAYLDEQIGRLLSFLDDAAVLDDTIVTGISDHGEALGEHNYVGHSHKIYQEQVHGVFLMRYPAAIPSGTEISAQIRNIDYYPTILELTGIP
ncbi:MAG: hypothetical protein E4H03_06710, partial [Myxococcales bacterium]